MCWSFQLIWITVNVNSTLTAARRVRALRASLSWVFVWSYLPCDDDVNEASSCDSRLSMSPELLLDTGLCLRSLFLNSNTRALRVSRMGFTTRQRHTTIRRVQRPPFWLLLLFREAWCSPGSRWGIYVVITFMFAFFHLSYIHLWSRGCSIHQSSQRISCSAVAGTTLWCWSCCCRMGPGKGTDIKAQTHILKAGIVTNQGLV